MLTHFYADNFRSLVNFEIKLDRINLLMGANGTGKSTVFEVLRRIQAFVAGDLRVHEAFPTSDITRWMDRNIQDFRIVLKLNDSWEVPQMVSYHLVIEHDVPGKRCRVKKEILSVLGRSLFEFADGDVHLYRDDYSRGPEYPYDWTMSGLAAIQARPDNTLLTAFKKSLAGFVIASILPSRMESESRDEAMRLDPHMENFVSWYRRLSQEKMGAMFTLFQELKDVIPGFDSFSYKTVAENTKSLGVMFSQDGNGKKLQFGFGELSDGQRVLIALYALIHSLKGEGLSLFLDEPDNYVTLREIQPWLNALSVECGESFEQAVLISHHPEVINYLGTSNGKWFGREAAGPSRVSEDAPAAADGLSLAETIARGWEER
jgi:predicted ATPase